MTSPPAASEIAVSFYHAFSQHDPEGGVRMIRPHAAFTDPVFGTLNAVQTAAMWRMLMGRAPEMTVSFELNRSGQAQPQPEVQTARGQWDAHYTLSQTGRPVHNVVQATMQMRDGLIYRHTDIFDFWRWARQALGLPGMLLGWTPALHRRVSGTALAGLQASMDASSISGGEN